MRFALVVLVACHAEPKPVAPTVPEVTNASANAAYQAKNYALCAEQFEAVAKTVPRWKRGDELYGAASCYALGGKMDAAFAALDQAIDAGFHTVSTLDTDTDMDSLRGDPRWAKMREHETATTAAWESSLGNPALRRELLKLVDEDQRVRFEWIEKNKRGEASFAELGDVDAKDVIEMHRIVAASGWPTISMVGADGAHAAWLLLQHADRDVAFQKQILEQMKKLVATGEVAMVDYAYLTDRVAINENRKQTYGTQFDEHQQPKPIEDEANVDARRKAVGLDTLAENRARLRQVYGDPK